MALQEPVLLEIYGDYTDPRIGRIFRRSKRVMKEFGQHRVVMRSPARTQDADRALRFTECARRVDLFVPVQWALLLHRGPWDLETLLGIGDTFQLERTSLSTCIESIDIQQQIEKDRSHSKEKKVQSIPALFVNGKRVGFDVKSLRRAIRSVVMDTSV